MKSTTCLPAPRRSANGMALVLTLCALVLITVLLVAFFSKAQITRQIAFSSTNISKSESITRAAAHFIIGELRQEIAESSDVLQGDPASPSGAYSAVYRLKEGFSPMPVKIGIDLPDAIGATTIVKVSANGAGVRRSSSVLASNIGIDQASLNGRKISPDKWFGLGGPRLGSQNTLPAWLYMTRSGMKTPNPSDASDQSSPDYVVGRFAYTVYDISGRLDANVAGYPIPSDAAEKLKMTEAAELKSSIAYADLAALDPTVFTEASINSLVQWRNGEAAKSADKYISYLDQLGASDGFLHAINESSAEPAKKFTQQRFLSRSDLLKSVQQGVLPGRPELFTHFSRESAKPSWSPDKNAADFGGGSATNTYRDDADKLRDGNGDLVANRNMANVRHASAGTFKRYNDDGTSYDVEVTSGDALVQRRFSLAKLAWLGHNGPDAAAFDSSISATEQGAAIKDCFGLTWNSTAKRWDYDHGASNAILTLGEIQNRDPDFFELLKAGILSGSLGGEPGEVADDIGAKSDPAKWTGPIGRDFETYSKSKDLHLLQIGANMIDQVDRDNFPTAIFQYIFDKSTVFSPSEDEFHNTVFGQENLPMLSRLGLICSMRGNYVADVPGKMGLWMQPEVWNPHQSATAGASPTDPNYPTPSALRVVTYGRSYAWNTGEDPSQSLPVEPVDFGNDFTAPKQEGTIYFKNPSPAPSSGEPVSFFNGPIAIKGWEKATVARRYCDKNWLEAQGFVPGPLNRYPENVTWVSSSVNSNQFVGVFMGQMDRNPAITSYNVRVIPDLQLTFVLEYYDGSTWRPYSSISRLETLHSAIGGSGSKFGSEYWIAFNGHVDARTHRFSGSAGRVATGANYTWETGKTIRPDSNTVGAAGKGPRPVSQAWPRATSGFTHTPTNGVYLFDEWAKNLDADAELNLTSRFRYKDPDGVTRPADAWRADYATGDGVMLYHQDTAGVTASAQRRRPIILNRPFRSVGELGYVFRDQPFKTLDLWSEKSADSGLLELFAVKEQSSAVIAGSLNPSSASAEVLGAIVKGARKSVGTGSLTVDEVEAGQIATGITDTVSANGGLADRAHLATRLGTPVFEKIKGNVSNRNKGHGETPMRALVNVSSMKSWNLLIDIVAQTGRVVGSGGLEKFTVEGERRYWISVSIDRATGEIVDKQIEAINE